MLELNDFKLPEVEIIPEVKVEQDSIPWVRGSAKGVEMVYDREIVGVRLLINGEDVSDIPLEQFVMEYIADQIDDEL